MRNLRRFRLYFTFSS